MTTTSTDALVLVDKPAGPSSFAVVRAVGRALGTRRVGHTGTLDPFASGLLVVLAGKATRLASYVPDEPKVYLATFAFGAETDTDDALGTVTCTAAVPAQDRVARAIGDFTGSITQVPPAFSAKQVAGRRAYDMARRGESPVLAPVAVRIDQWEVIAWHGPALTVRITCGRGTYIRALARDLGRAVGSAAHCASLRRERAGPFSVDGASTWDDLQAGRVHRRPPLDALVGMPVVVLAAADADRARHGVRIPGEGASARAALLREDGALIGLAARDNGFWHPDVVFADD